MKISLKVIPGASREGVVGWLGDALKVRVKAPAESGKANQAVEKLLARALQLPRSNITIVQGATTPRKVVEISGLTLAELNSRLELQR